MVWPLKRFQHEGKWSDMEFKGTWEAAKAEEEGVHNGSGVSWKGALVVTKGSGEICRTKAA